MLKKDYRLSKSKDIKETSLHGRSFFNPFYVIKYAPGPEVRLTVIASTKVSKKAVERNRIKRAIREGIRHELPYFKGGNYVIIVKAKAAFKPGTHLRESLLQLLAAVRLIRPHDATNS